MSGSDGGALLELTGLTRRYAGLVAVDSVDMQVAPGGVHAVIGPNGAGKTTLFNLVSGLVAYLSWSLVESRFIRRGSPTIAALG